MFGKDIILSDEFVDRMWRFALSILGDGEEARDVVQDVLLRFCRKTLVLTNVEAYLLKAVRNACIDILRARRFWDEGEPESAIGEDPHGSWEAGELVRFAMSKLGLKQRMAVQLKDIEGYTTEDVAKILGVKENQVRVILSRARMKIKETIEKENEGR